ncbi:hypothetical protein [Pseudothauera rhizosphaerae]|nr:hypothetical protein [Pseudothauera rhizosphaerae]
MFSTMRGLPARLAGAAFAARRVVLYLVAAAVLMNLAMGSLTPGAGV